MAKIIHVSFNRGSGIKRRCRSYQGHVPDKRRAIVRRISAERGKGWIRTLVVHHTEKTP